MATRSAPRGGWRRWCLLLAATAAATLLSSLSASEAFGQSPTPRGQAHAVDRHALGHLACQTPTGDCPVYPPPYYVCPNGVVTNIYPNGCLAPLPATPTGTLSGGFTSTATTTNSYCLPPTVVVGITRFADPVNKYTGGVRAICQGLTSAGALTGSPTVAPVIGATSATSATVFCPSGQVIRGIYGRAGDIVDAVGVTCGYITTTTTTNGPWVGGIGGVAKGPFNCPYGMYLIGLQGRAAPYDNGLNVIGFSGSCAAPSGTLSSAAPTGGTWTYRASASRGPVRFSMLISKASDKRSSWYYAIDHLVVATGCSRSASVPGAIIVSDRSRVSQERKFSGRPDGFRIAGRVFGPLASPKVRGTVTVLKGACRGEVVGFTAVRSR